MRPFAISGLLLALAGQAGAHARLTAPVPRNDFDDIKDSNALHPPPCGGPRSTVVMAQPPGTVIKVEWDETIDHPGHYEIAFAMANDANFTMLTDPNGVTLNNITDVQGGTLPHHYTQMVKLPSTACAACTLQLNQLMLGAGYYHSCADVQITSTAPSPAPVVDGGVPADSAVAPQSGTPNAPTPSTPPGEGTPPTDAPPDLAAAPPPGPTQYDYSYGCSTAPGAPSLWALIMLLGALGAARMVRRSRSR